jgi:SAM-dependent methyltransferase
MADKLNSSGQSLFDFGPLAPLYEDWYTTPEGEAHDIVQQRDMNAMIQPARGPQRLLDVGCGTGHWSRFFSALGYEVQGIDISGEMIRTAREISDGCRFDVGNACDLPFPDAAFDITASITALEFIPDQAAAVREMARCTRPGGVLIIGTLNRIAPVNRDRLDEGEEPFASAKLLGPDELMKLISPLGEVRMVASTVAGPAQHPTAISAAHQPEALKHITGPLLVAQVQL